MTSLPGILTSTAAVIAAIGAAFFGGRQVGLASPTPAVTTTFTVTASPLPSPSASPSPSDSSPLPPGSSTAPGTAGEGQAFLSAMQPTDGTVGSPSDGPVQIGATVYPNSVGFTCDGSGYLTYNVAGDAFLDAELGVPSDSAYATGTTTTVTFYKDGTTKELTAPITLVVGSPKKISLPLQGTTQLEISCQGINDTSHNPTAVDLGLGDATVGSS